MPIKLCMHRKWLSGVWLRWRNPDRLRGKSWAQEQRVLQRIQEFWKTNTEYNNNNSYKQCVWYKKVLRNKVWTHITIMVNKSCIIHLIPWVLHGHYCSNKECLVSYLRYNYHWNWCQKTMHKTKPFCTNFSFFSLLNHPRNLQDLRLQCNVHTTTTHTSWDSTFAWLASCPESTFTGIWLTASSFSLSISFNNTSLSRGTGKFLSCLRSTSSTSSFGCWSSQWLTENNCTVYQTVKSSLACLWCILHVLCSWLHNDVLYNEVGQRTKLTVTVLELDHRLY